ncbi:hypothetical protein BDV29DRAFT_182910 [Aspergillus leporis]|uniref:Uncharacterized protein n=1 Tax=Aspergillus leporis TaxID=41062 RepID=A0A5N5WQC3_9EURO|nr:hypothetical protein BDV29DRAFT_182910 [Aspergillus leporis]
MLQRMETRRCSKCVGRIGLKSRSYVYHKGTLAMTCKLKDKVSVYVPGTTRMGVRSLRGTRSVTDVSRVWSTAY